MNFVEHAICHIESNLRTPLTLSSIAAACAIDRFHLSRAFRAATGLSVMAYVRARRLTEAAHELSLGDADILTVALNVQFGSHEAFTRAFSNYFGVLPSTVRSTRSLVNLKLMETLRMDNSLLVELPAPRLVDQNAFTICGLTGRYTFESNQGIPALWESFLPRMTDVPSTASEVAYGVCYDANAEGQFSYMAGLATDADANVPADMVSVDIPAGRYAVFSHVGHISDIRKTIYTIWNKALADEGFTHRKAPDFERYDERFNPESDDSTVEIWIPVIAA